MKKTLKIFAIMIIVAIVMGVVNISNAFSFNANLSSNDKLVAGQEVEIVLSLNDIDMDDGIRSIKVGEITVGEEFEEITQTNFSGNAMLPTYSNGGLVLMSGAPIKDSGAVVTLKLKVKPTITSKESTVKFENIVASSGSNTGDISVGTKSITINANESENNGDGSGTTNSNTTNNASNGSEQVTKPTQSEQSTDKKTNSVTKEVTSSKTSPTKLPKAGYATGIMISLILIAIAIGIISFMKYRKTR